MATGVVFAVLKGLVTSFGRIIRSHRLVSLATSSGHVVRLVW